MSEIPAVPIARVGQILDERLEDVVRELKGANLLAELAAVDRRRLDLEEDDGLSFVEIEDELDALELRAQEIRAAIWPAVGEAETARMDA